VLIYINRLAVKLYTKQQRNGTTDQHLCASESLRNRK